MNNNLGNLQPKDSTNAIIWWLDFVQVLFPVFLFTYLLLILIETLFPGRVSSYLNLNYLLIIVIILGIAAMLGEPIISHNKTLKRNTFREKFLMICAGVGGAFIIWYKIHEIGWISYVTSIFAGGLIVSLPTRIREEDEGEEIEGKDSQGN